VFKGCLHELHVGGPEANYCSTALAAVPLIDVPDHCITHLNLSFVDIFATVTFIQMTEWKEHTCYKVSVATISSLQLYRADNNKWKTYVLFGSKNTFYISSCES